VSLAVWNLTQKRDTYQYNLKLATLKHMIFRLNNIHGLKLTKFHKFLEQEMDYDSPTNLAKYMNISKLQYQLQLFLQGTIFNNQVHYKLLFILQTHKMKSWLLILGAIITLLNLPASLACNNSKYFNISQ
jgi:hypothetical protein